MELFYVTYAPFLSSLQQGSSWEIYLPHVKINQVMQAKNIFLGLLTTIYTYIQKSPQAETDCRASSRLPWLLACKKIQHFNISANLLTLLQQDMRSKGALAPALLCWSTRKRAQMEYEVLWTFISHNAKSVFGPKRRKSRPSAMLTEDSKALLGSTARSWHAALWHRTDECPDQGQGSLFVLHHCLTPLPVQAKKCH